MFALDQMIWQQQLGIASRLHERQVFFSCMKWVLLDTSSLHFKILWKVNASRVGGREFSFFSQTVIHTQMQMVVIPISVQIILNVFTCNSIFDVRRDAALRWTSLSNDNSFHSSVIEIWDWRGRERRWPDLRSCESPKVITFLLSLWHWFTPAASMPSDLPVLFVSAFKSWSLSGYLLKALLGPNLHN